MIDIGLPCVTLEAYLEQNNLTETCPMFCKCKYIGLIPCDVGVIFTLCVPFVLYKWMHLEFWICAAKFCNEVVFQFRIACYAVFLIWIPVRTNWTSTPWLWFYFFREFDYSLSKKWVLGLNTLSLRYSCLVVYGCRMSFPVLILRGFEKIALALYEYKINMSINPFLDVRGKLSVWS